MSIGAPCSRLMQVAMGSAVYGTPHMTSKRTSATFPHITSATCTARLARNTKAACLYLPSQLFCDLPSTPCLFTKAVCLHLMRLMLGTGSRERCRRVMLQCRQEALNVEATKWQAGPQTTKSQDKGRGGWVISAAWGPRARKLGGSEGIPCAAHRGRRQ